MEIDYFAYNSGLKNYNADLKIIFALDVLIIVLFGDSIILSAFVFLTMSLITLFMGKIPFEVYLKFVSIPIAFMVLSCLAIVFNFSGKEAGIWNFKVVCFYVFVTEKSIMRGCGTFVKAAAGMSTVYMLALSTTINEIIIFMRKLHLPSIICELMNLIYRYVFILLDSAYKMQTAAKSRLGYEGFFKAYRSFAGIGGNLFIISLKKANEYYDAMLSRGYNGKIEFLNEEHKVKIIHVVMCALYVTVLIFIKIIWS